MIELHIKNHVTRLIAPIEVMKAVSDLLSYEVEGAFFAMRKMPPGAWDGRKRMVRPDGSFPAGLTAQVIHHLIKEKLKIDKVEDLRTRPERRHNFKLLRDIVPRDYQEEAATLTDERVRGIYNVGTGGGKCHARGTRLLMHDGSTKAVEDVVVGDRLMGPDSKPRTILSTCAGREEMARITPVKGDSWECNLSHVLSLRCTADHSRKYRRGEVVNITVADYLQQPDKFKHMMKLWRTGVEFQEQATALDPYLLGLWLGDGTFRCSAIHNQDKEILSYLQTGTDCRTQWDRTTYRTQVYGISKQLGEARSDGQKRIPSSYKINGRRQRLNILAGLLDTDGYYHNGHYEIITKHSGLRDDILFVARSLGLAAYSSEKIGTIKSLGFSGRYHRVTISGELSDIPCRVARKKASVRRQKKNVLNVGFSVETLPEDDYFGFEIDGDHLYLLADFTVTHNTVIASLITQRRGVDTLFIVPDAGLKDQCYGEFVSFFGERNVSMEIESRAPIVVTNIHQIDGFLPTKAKGAKTPKPPRKDPRAFERFGMLLVDEFHHAASERYLNLNRLASNAYWRYGLTGTFVRPDGRDMIMMGVLSNMLMKRSASDLITAGWLVPADVSIHRYKLKGFSGLNYKEAYSRVVRDGAFNNFVAARIRERVRDEGKQTLVLVRYKEHGNILKDMLAGDALYVDGDDSREKRDHVKRLFAEKKIRCLIATNIFGEGQDIPSIDCLINARLQESEIQTKQGIGRALRLARGARNYSESVTLGKSRAYVEDFLIEGNKHLRGHSNSRIEQYQSEPQFRVTIIGD